MTRWRYRKPLRNIEKARPLPSDRIGQGLVSVESIPLTKSKALEEAPANIRRRLDERISELLGTPFPAGCKKLRGAQNAYRLRVGD